jgi:hypothetical protein
MARISSWVKSFSRSLGFSIPRTLTSLAGLESINSRSTAQSKMLLNDAMSEALIVFAAIFCSVR